MTTFKAKDGLGVVQEFAAVGSGTAIDPYKPIHQVEIIKSASIFEPIPASHDVLNLVLGVTAQLNAVTMPADAVGILIYLSSGDADSVLYTRDGSVPALGHGFPLIATADAGGFVELIYPRQNALLNLRFKLIAEGATPGAILQFDYLRIV